MAKENTPGRPYGGLSLAERKTQRKEQFLQAGLNIFGTTGYRDATVRSLCKEAQLTDRYFYESFGSLEKLLTSVYEHCMNKLGNTVLLAISTEFNNTNAINAMRAGLDAYFLLLEDERIARVCMVELEGISPEINEHYYRYIDGFAQLLIGLCQRAYPKWQLNRKEQEILAISMVGAMRQVATHWHRTNYADDRATMVSATHKLFLSMMNLVESDA